MKKIIALSALLATAGAYAQSTSTTTIETSQKSITQRMRLSYFGELGKSVVSENTTAGKNSSFYNSLIGSFELDSKSKVTMSVRGSFVDSADENGKGDRFSESDTRLGYNTVIYKGDTDRLKFFMTVELPTSRGSQDSEKITRLKPALMYTAKIDDYNSILIWGGYNKTINRKATAATDATSKYYLTPWISYSNSKLSEKYKLRLDYEGLLQHKAGSYDGALQQAVTSERIIGGVNTDIAGVDTFAFIAHYPYLAKASDQLGAGVQLFKSF